MAHTRGQYRTVSGDADGSSRRTHAPFSVRRVVRRRWCWLVVVGRFVLVSGARRRDASLLAGWRAWLLVRVIVPPHRRDSREFEVTHGLYMYAVYEKVSFAMLRSRTSPIPVGGRSLPWQPRRRRRRHRQRHTPAQMTHTTTCAQPV